MFLIPVVLAWPMFHPVRRALIRAPTGSACADRARSPWAEAAIRTGQDSADSVGDPRLGNPIETFSRHTDSAVRCRARDGGFLWPSFPRTKSNRWTTALSTLDDLYEATLKADGGFHSEETEAIAKLAEEAMACGSVLDPEMYDAVQASPGRFLFVGGSARAPSTCAELLRQRRSAASYRGRADNCARSRANVRSSSPASEEDAANVAALQGAPAHAQARLRLCTYKYLGHRNIQNTVRYTELSPARFKDFWRR
jgi:hypothetical protein